MVGGIFSVSGGGWRYLRVGGGGWTFFIGWVGGGGGK